MFLEGNDDVRFFSAVIIPLLRVHYPSVEIITYAGLKSVKVDKFVKSILFMQNDYVLVADIDQEPNVRVKKRILLSRFDALQGDHIMVIIKEIESWYLAGIDDHTSMKLGIKQLRQTDFVTKELFNRWIPRIYPSRIAFMVELLKHFSIDIAERKNRSFKHFMARYHLDEQQSLNAMAHWSTPMNAGREVLPERGVNDLSRE